MNTSARTDVIGFTACKGATLSKRRQDVLRKSYEDLETRSAAGLVNNPSWNPDAYAARTRRIKWKKNVNFRAFRDF